MDKTNGFPKTIILCQNKINEFSGGGVVLSNLFGNVAPEYLMFFHRDLEYDGGSEFVEKRLCGHWLKFNFFNAIELVIRWCVASMFSNKNTHFRDHYFLNPANILTTINVLV